VRSQQIQRSLQLIGQNPRDHLQLVKTQWTSSNCQVLQHVLSLDRQHSEAAAHGIL
jgi:hypothetical protein